MKKHRNHLFTTIILVLIILAAFYARGLYESNNEVDSISFMISLVSIIISLISFFIATYTYLSIDSVNKLTKMEGNKLENREYTLSLPELLDFYNQEDADELANDLFKDLNKRFKKDSKTSIAFTNHIQHLIDILVFFPAIFDSTSDKGKFDKRKNQLLELIRKKQYQFNSYVSTGDLIQVDEAIKLIEGVFAYQEFDKSKANNPGYDLLKVRGSVLKNAVTQIVYYNYLGLFYNKKALAEIYEVLNLEGKNLLQKENAKEVYEKLSDIEMSEKEIINLYLEESLMCFDKAKEHSGLDVMWTAYIDYNIGRNLFYVDALKSVKTNEWKEYLNHAVLSRYKLNMIVKEILPIEITHLSKHYIYQEVLARLVQSNLLSAVGDNSNYEQDRKRFCQEHKEIIEEYGVLKQYL